MDVGKRLFCFANFKNLIGFSQFPIYAGMYPQLRVATSSLSSWGVDVMVVPVCPDQSFEREKGGLFYFEKQVYALLQYYNIITILIHSVGKCTVG